MLQKWLKITHPRCGTTERLTNLPKITQLSQASKERVGNLLMSHSSDMEAEKN